MISTHDIAQNTGISVRLVDDVQMVAPELIEYIQHLADHLIQAEVELSQTREFYTRVINTLEETMRPGQPQDTRH